VDKNEVIEIAEGGIHRRSGGPEHGRQDLGYSSGGAQDRFSLATGNILLGHDTGTPALEIVAPAPIRFLRDCCFVLTGGAFSNVRLDAPRGSRAVEHGEVVIAPSGAGLSFGERSYGFRTYLCFREAPKDWERIAGRRRGEFTDIARWPDAEGRIRVLPGPEYRVLREPALFFEVPWKTTADVSDMGLRLGGVDTVAGMAGGGLESMISGPVNDGTIQLTPEGPIVLLRQRQTVGGYPRVLNVISADVDLLAQFGPYQSIRFCLISVEEAWKIASVRRDDIDRLRERYRE
jgi:allophanate hydrolase subunit 2